MCPAESFTRWDVLWNHQTNVNLMYYLIKLLSLFQACVFYSPFVALSIFVDLSNFCRIIKLLPSWSFELFSSGLTLVWWFHMTSHSVKLSAGWLICLSSYWETNQYNHLKHSTKQRDQISMWFAIKAQHYLLCFWWIIQVNKIVKQWKYKP